MSVQKDFLEEKLVREGYKLTKNRKLILEVLRENCGSWITAQELHEKVLAKNNRINFSTVYRNLDVLTGLGILCEVDKGQGMNFYSLNFQDNHHHHLICKSCGRTRRVEFCPLRELGIEHFEDFTVEEHKFEIYGYCSNCKKNTTG